jgi:hypothetical protein
MTHHRRHRRDWLFQQFQFLRFLLHQHRHRLYHLRQQKKFHHHRHRLRRLLLNLNKN